MHLRFAGPPAAFFTVAKFDSVDKFRARFSGLRWNAAPINLFWRIFFWSLFLWWFLPVRTVLCIVSRVPTVVTDNRIFICLALSIFILFSIISAIQLNPACLLAFVLLNWQVLAPFYPLKYHILSLRHFLSFRDSSIWVTHFPLHNLHRGSSSMRYLRTNYENGSQALVMALLAISFQKIDL